MSQRTAQQEDERSHESQDWRDRGSSRGSSKRPPACVIGDMLLVRPILRAGIPCAMVAPPDDTGNYSRSISAMLEWINPASHPEQFVGMLLAYGKAQPEPPVLFYETDPAMLAISRFRDRLMPAFRFVIADPELVEDLADKWRFQQLADRLDLPVPLSRRISPARSQSLGDLDIPFPVVVKPLSRSGQRWSRVGGASKALSANSIGELSELWDRLARANVEVIVQERVQGPESSIESYHVYVDGTGSIAGEFTGKKIRTLPIENGMTTSLVITSQTDVAELGREVIRRMDLRGVAKLDFKRAPNGRLYLLEVNPRFNLWHHAAAVAGVNLPALVYADLLGLPRPPARLLRPGLRWCSPLDDLRSARAAGMPIWRWLLWALRCEVKGDITWNDPMPTLSVVAGRLGRSVWSSKSVRKPAMPEQWSDANHSEPPTSATG